MAFSFVFAPMLLLFAAFGGTGNEILDVVDSKTYWKIAGIEQSAEALIPLIDQEERPAPDLTKLEAFVADLSSPEFVKRQKAMAALTDAGADARPVLEKAQKSGDPEVATAASLILSKMSRVASDSRLHRLMAIRTLGELKAVGAVPHLEKLTTSPEPFVGEYASRALASIRGEKYTPKPPDPLALEKDLATTYPSVAAIFHSKMAPRDGDVAIRAMMDKGMALIGGIGGIAGGPAPGMPEMEEMLTEMTTELVKVFQRLGNVRIDSITSVIPTGVDLDRGGFITTVRGLYDHKRALDFIKEESGGDFEITRVGDIEWIGDGDDVFVHMPSDELLIFIAGEEVGAYVEAVSDRLAGKDKSPLDGPAVALLKDIPKDARGFVAAEIPKAMAEGDEVLSIFKTIVGSVSEIEKGKIALKVRLRGDDPKKVGEIFTQMNMGVAMGKGAVSAMAKAEKKLAELAEMMDSIKLAHEGGKITGEATIPGAGSMPFGLLFGFFAGVRSVDMVPPDAVIEDVELIEPEIEVVPLEKAPKKIPAPK